MTAGLGTGRREALLGAKARGLVRGRWGEVVDGARPGTFPGGSTLRSGPRGWVLAEDRPERSLGGALAWALTVGVEELHLLATGAAGDLARRAAWFRLSPVVWPIEGAALAAEPALPAALPPEPATDPRAEPFREVIQRAGADVVAEGGVLRAEVRGLEVARVEIDEAGARLAVGVGKHDREAHRELDALSGADTAGDRLFDVVRTVAEFRHAGGAGHAAYHLASERWLRTVVVRRPELVGAASLQAAPSPVVRDDLRQPAPAPAAGVDVDGRPLLAVCSVGLDADLVPAAVDAWLRDGREPRLVLVVPEGDDHPAMRRVAADLVVAAEVAVVPRDWRSL